MKKGKSNFTLPHSNLVGLTHMSHDHKMKTFLGNIKTPTHSVININMSLKVIILYSSHSKKQSTNQPVV